MVRWNDSLKFDAFILQVVVKTHGLGTVHKVRTPQNGHFRTPTHPCTQKYASALPPTPPLYKRILETHFQNTMNVKISKNINRTNP